MKKNILGTSEYEVIESVKTAIKRKIKNKEICDYALTCVTSINAKEYSIKENEFGMKDDLACFQISFEPSITNAKIIKILYVMFLACKYSGSWNKPFCKVSPTLMTGLVTYSYILFLVF